MYNVLKIDSKTRSETMRVLFLYAITWKMENRVNLTNVHHTSESIKFSVFQSNEL